MTCSKHAWTGRRWRGVAVIDPLTSLPPSPDDAVCGVAVRRLKQIAASLNCTVAVVNHTQHRQPPDEDDFDPDLEFDEPED